MARLLKKLFIHNLALKLIALLAAALLWLYVITEKEYSFKNNFALET